MTLRGVISGIRRGRGTGDVGDPSGPRTLGRRGLPEAYGPDQYRLIYSGFKGRDSDRVGQVGTAIKIKKTNGPGQIGSPDIVWMRFDDRDVRPFVWSRLKRAEPWEAIIDKLGLLPWNGSVAELPDGRYGYANPRLIDTCDLSTEERGTRDTFVFRTGGQLWSWNHETGEAEPLFSKQLP
jgi:hypothetical protein